MWAVTRSPYLLAFAFLGPVVALGSLLDARWKAARSGRRETVRFAVELTAVAAAIESGHALERAEREAAVPSAARILASHERDPERWRRGLGAELAITLGRGTAASTLTLSGDTPRRPGDPTDALADLRESAAVLEDAPVVVDARLGIGVCGPLPLALAVARGIALQLANALSPAETRISIGQHQGWMTLLPHECSQDAAGSMVRFAPAGGGAASDVGSVVLAVSESIDALPRECRVVLSVVPSVAGAAAVVRHPSPGSLGPVRPEPVTEVQAGEYARMLSRSAKTEGLVSGGAKLPDLLRLDALARLAVPTGSSLACAFAEDASGALILDLVRDGPHAVIGGTTGSGKSELLVSWVLAMAERYGPDAVNFLLVDFKGGSSFAALEALPHCAGVITDLDEQAAGRALASLRAELRHRERVMARSGVRSIEELGDLPRLVIVVDEFAAMVAGFPELHGLFSDIAARGRSLGVHLILCTQRPAGVVRDAVLANCTLRLSLRVNNAADSIAVIGTTAAAELARVPLGRGFVSVAGSAPDRVQVALADAADAERITRRWPPIPLRRPWCDPLPAGVAPEDLPRPDPGDESAIGFGLIDLPDEQRQARAVYDPARDGNLLVLGAHACGKSTALAALAAGAGPSAQWIPSTVAGSWDDITALLTQIRAGQATGRLVLLDDLDALLPRFPEEYQRAILDLLSAVLREGGSAGVQLAIAVQRLPAALHGVSSLCDARLLLRMPDRQEHVLAGGTAAQFVADLSPGGAWWRGHRVQIASVPVPGRPGEPDPPRLNLTGLRGLAVVSGRPRELATRFERRAEVSRVVNLAETPSAAIEVTDGGAGRIPVFVADAETWQTHWSLLERARAVMPLLFDGCAVADFRAITRSRALPPPLSPGADALWQCDPGGAVSRVRL